jgi:5-methylcytosine-specific restriction endonuclease McrA
MLAMPWQKRIDKNELKALKFSRSISAKLRAAVLNRDDLTCQMCGIARGEIDEASGRKVCLHIGHIQEKILGGKDELMGLRVLCSTCNRGAKYITAERPSAIWLLSQIRRGGLDDQRTVFDWLSKKFGGAH